MLKKPHFYSRLLTLIQTTSIRTTTQHPPKTLKNLSEDRLRLTRITILRKTTVSKIFFKASGKRFITLSINLHFTAIKLRPLNISISSL